VTLKGEVLYVSQVTTVEELQERLQEELGLDPLEQGRVTFRGKVLESTDCLSEAGMEDGDQINIIPTMMANQWKLMTDMGGGLLTLIERVQGKGKDNVTSEERKDMEVMTKLYDDLTKVPYMQDEMERFSEHLRSPATMERATDPERIESLRHVILHNPMLLKYVTESKASQEALQDPDAWFRYVQDSVQQWQTMDGYELWQKLNDGNLFGGKE
jgi:hypothetical protein